MVKSGNKWNVNQMDESQYKFWNQKRLYYRNHFKNKKQHQIYTNVTILEILFWGKN